MQNYHMDRCKYNDNIWSDVAAYKQKSYIGHAFRIRPGRGTPKSKKICSNIIRKSSTYFFRVLVMYKESFSEEFIYPNPLGSGP